MLTRFSRELRRPPPPPAHHTVTRSSEVLPDAVRCVCLRCLLLVQGLLRAVSEKLGPIARVLSAAKVVRSLTHTHVEGRRCTHALPIHFGLGELLLKLGHARIGVDKRLTAGYIGFNSRPPHSCSQRDILALLIAHAVQDPEHPIAQPKVLRKHKKPRRMCCIRPPLPVRVGSALLAPTGFHRPRPSIASPSSSIVCRVLLAVWLRARIDHEGIAAEAHLD
mmetsp:Transcript_22469/g.50775  ORF Transcript_22469/g.50775 Transcript_22469/m.50775 type:complete len:221 (+) Transcript_22469:325-987(+)